MKPGKGLSRGRSTNLLATPKPKAAVKPVKPKVAVIPAGERYNQNAKPDPLGRFDVTGTPFPADRLAASDAPAKKAAAEAKMKQERADRAAARRAGYKE